MIIKFPRTVEKSKDFYQSSGIYRDILFAVLGYVGEISVILAAVEAVAYDKVIGNGEKRDVGLEFNGSS